MSAQRAGRAEAAAAIWRWRSPEEPPEPVVGTGRIRVRGCIQAAIVAALGLGLRYFGLHGVGLVALCAAAVLLTAALLSPRGIYALIDRAARAVGTWIGRGITWALLVPLFYGFFLPFGLLFRRGSRDRMKRALDPEAPSYWEAIEGPTAATPSLEKQW